MFGSLSPSIEEKQSQQKHLLGGFKYFLFSPRTLGFHDPIWRLRIFFRWVAVETTNLSPSNRQDFDKQIRQSAFSCNDEVGASSAKPLEMMLLGLVGWLKLKYGWGMMLKICKSRTVSKKINPGNSIISFKCILLFIHPSEAYRIVQPLWWLSCAAKNRQI